MLLRQPYLFRKQYLRLIQGTFMADPVLYDYWRSSAAYRVRIAMNIKGIPYKSQAVHLVRDGGEQKLPSYKAVNPQALVPSLALQNGDVITQSLAIIDYLDETVPTPALLPSDPVLRAQVRAMAYLIACDIHPINNLRILKYLKSPLDHAQEDIDTWYRHWVAEGFAALEALAAPFNGDYLAGNSVSLADICLVPQMYNARRLKCDLSPYPRLVAVDARLQAIEAIAKAAPEKQPDAVL